MYTDVTKWLDSILNQELPAEVVAFCFNLYEDGESNWSMELIGSERFDAEDEDWCCDEITDFGTREAPFVWNTDEKWDAVLETVIGVLKKYMESGKYAAVLKEKAAVGVGFVDGDIVLLYTK